MPNSYAGENTLVHFCHIVVIVAAQVRKIIQRTPNTIQFDDDLKQIVVLNEIKVNTLESLYLIYDHFAKEYVVI